MVLDLKTVVSHPAFKTLPPEEQRKAIERVSPEFVGLPPVEQEKFLQKVAVAFGGAQASDIPKDTVQSHERGMEAAVNHEPFATPIKDALRKTGDLAVRPMAEGLGTTAGGILGATTINPAITALGGGIGYAGGKWLADRYDEMTGNVKERGMLDTVFDPVGDFMLRGSAAEVLSRPVRDAVGGVGMGALGDVAALGAVKGIDAVNRVKDLVIKGKMASVAKGSNTFPTVGATKPEKKVKEWLETNISDGKMYAANIEEARQIENLINAGQPEGAPKFQFNLGQRSAEPNAIKLERSVTLPFGKAANAKVERDAENMMALTDFYNRNFKDPEGAQEFIASLSGRADALKNVNAAKQSAAQAARDAMPTQADYEAGETLLASIDKAKGPVKRQMNELEAAIPDYPMEFTNLETEILLIKKDSKLSIDQRRAVEEFEKNDLPKLIENGKTTFAWMGLNRTLGDRAATLRESGNAKVAAIFERLRHQGLKPDMDAVSDMARTGKIFEHNGRAVNVDEIATKLEADMKYLAELKAKADPDVEAMKAAIKQVEQPQMQVVRESNESYAKRIEQQYKYVTGNKEVPVISANQADIDRLTERIAATKQIINEVSPGQDVGVAVKAFNEYASNQYFKRFKGATMEQVTRPGDQPGGVKIAIEQIPKRFKTQSGAIELKRALGDEGAKDAMRGNLGYDLLRQGSDDAEKLTAAGYKRWLKRNETVLKEYGLYDEFKTVTQAQEIADAAKLKSTQFEKDVAGAYLNSDPGKVISKIVSGYDTAAKMREALAAVKYDPAAIRGLKSAYASWVDDTAETTWKQLLTNKPTVSQAAFSRAMKKSAEAAKVLFRDEPEKLKALQTMQRAYEISFRSSRSPVTTNSDTAEKGATLINQIAVGALDHVATGGYGLAVRSAKKVVDLMRNMGEKRVNEIFARAVYDPEYAYLLVRGMRGQIEPDQMLVGLNNKVIRLDDYKRSAYQQMATGAGATGTAGNNE